MQNTSHLKLMSNEESFCIDPPNSFHYENSQIEMSNLAHMNDKDIENLNMVTDGVKKATKREDESERSPYARNDLYRKKAPTTKVGSTVGLGFETTKRTKDQAPQDVMDQKWEEWGVEEATQLENFIFEDLDDSCGKSKN